MDFQKYVLGIMSSNHSICLDQKFEFPEVQYTRAPLFGALFLTNAMVRIWKPLSLTLEKLGGKGHGLSKVLPCRTVSNPLLACLNQ